MKQLARWAWVAVLGTALSLSWWSLDALSRHYGMPALLAGMVSAAIDGAALVASNIALQRATAADSAAGAKLFMVGTVGLSAWLNFQHGLLLHYPVAVHVLFAAPSVISGWLLELQLRNLHRARLRDLDKVAQPLPRFGILIWCFHPFAALRRLSQIAGSRLRSVPVSVMDWTPAPMTEPEEDALTAAAAHPMILAAPVESSGGVIPERGADKTRAPRKSGRTPVPDEKYLGQLRELVAEGGGMVPSAREVARQLSVGQARARRLVAALEEEHANAATATAPLRIGSDRRDTVLAKLPQRLGTLPRSQAKPTKGGRYKYSADQGKELTLQLDTVSAGCPEGAIVKLDDSGGDAVRNGPGDIVGPGDPEHRRNMRFDGPNGDAERLTCFLAG